MASLWKSISGFSIALGRPGWLALLPLLAIFYFFWSRHSLAGLGRWRGRLAKFSRLLVLSLIVLALAEPQIVWKNDRLTTLYLVDLSQSVPRDRIEPMLNFVRQSTIEHRQAEDLAGMVVFSKNARVEVPPAPSEIRFLGVESTLQTDNTDLAGALKLAMGSFPEDSARRIVLISDGNQNRGNVFEQALQGKAQGIQIDVLPVNYNYDNEQEVLVEKVSLPTDVKVGETVNLNVVLRATAPAKGFLQVFQNDSKGGRTPAVGNEQPIPVDLPRGVSVYTLKQVIRESSFYRFSAEFIPDRTTADKRAVNNIAEGFTQARGPAKVLLIESRRGEHTSLVNALREKKIEVDTLLAPTIDGGGDVGGDQLPTDIGQLQPYDAVILGNVPKDSFSASQIALLERNVHDMGAGLIMLGGDKSFGAGGWRNTPVEKALPVDMEIKSMKVTGKGALVMIMHASEIAEGNYWQKVVAQESLKTLSPLDMAGMLHWQGTESWLFTLREISSGRDIMLRAIDRMTPGDMPDFDPSLRMAASALSKTDAASRLIIIISDGDPTPPTSQAIQQLVAAKVQVTTVLTAAHGNDVQGVRTMQDLAQRTKGR
ncbi:MAG: VWA domain-containing protein, partial [bacterium]